MIGPHDSKDFDEFFSNPYYCIIALKLRGTLIEDYLLHYRTLQKSKKYSPEEFRDRALAHIVEFSDRAKKTLLRLKNVNNLLLYQLLN